MDLHIVAGSTDGAPDGVWIKQSHIRLDKVIGNRLISIGSQGIAITELAPPFSPFALDCGTNGVACALPREENDVVDTFVENGLLFTGVLVNLKNELRMNVHDLSGHLVKQLDLTAFADVTGGNVNSAFWVHAHVVQNGKLYLFPRAQDSADTYSLDGIGYHVAEIDLSTWAIKYTGFPSAVTGRFFAAQPFHVGQPILDAATGKNLSAEVAKNYQNDNVTFSPDYQKALIGPAMGGAPDVAVPSTLAVFDGQDWKVLLQARLSPTNVRLTNEYFAFQDESRTFRYSFARKSWISWPLSQSVRLSNKDGKNKLVSEDLSAFLAPVAGSRENEMTLGTLVQISDDNAKCVATSLTIGSLGYQNDGYTQYSLSSGPDLVVAETNSYSVTKGLARVAR